MLNRFPKSDHTPGLAALVEGFCYELGKRFTIIFPNTVTSGYQNGKSQCKKLQSNHHFPKKWLFSYQNQPLFTKFTKSFTKWYIFKGFYFAIRLSVAATIFRCIGATVLWYMCTGCGHFSCGVSVFCAVTPGKLRSCKII